MLESDITVRSVETREDLNSFVHFTNELYKDNKYYVPEFEPDLKKDLDPNNRPANDFLQVMPMIAWAGDKAVGRVVAVINRNANERWKERTVRFGLLDFIDDETVAKKLLDAVAKYGKERGMTHIEGPMGITDFDKEGMLLEDYNILSSINTYYNAPYYPVILEKLGFVKKIDWVQLSIPVPEKTPEIYSRIARRAEKMHNVHLRITTDEEIRSGLGQRIFRLFNEAYNNIYGFSSFTEWQAQDLIDRYITLVDKRLMPILENGKGELVGAAITMGSLSKAMQKAHGKMWPFGWWHLLKSLKLKREKTVEMLLIGLRPDYQGTGVNTMFFDYLIPLFNKLGFETAETGPQLENNVKELSQWKYLNGKTVKRRRCYVKLI